MSETPEQTISNVVDMVNEAQSRGKFKLADVIKGVGYPEDIVDIYLDSESAYKISKLNNELIATADVKKIKEIEDEIEPLTKKVLASRVRFFMRGIDQKMIEQLEAKAQADNVDNDDSDYWLVDYMCALVAANIYKIEDAEGNVDESVYTLEDAKEWRGSLPAEGWGALQNSMQKLTLATGYFKGLTDAGFLPKS